MMAVNALKRLRPFRGVGLMAVLRGRAAFISWLNSRDSHFWWSERRRRAPFPLCVQKAYVNKNQLVCSILSVIWKYLISTFILWLPLFQYLLSI
jgi:hypothetical protein